MLEPPDDPPAEPTPTARFTAWVRETVAPELGGPTPPPQSSGRRRTAPSRATRG